MNFWGYFIHFSGYDSWRKNKKCFSCGALLLYVMHEVFIKVHLFQGTCSALCRYNSHPIFCPNIWVFANLPVYRKPRRPRIYCLVLFWRWYKIVCTCALETLVSLICKRYRLFLFINNGIIIFISGILKKTKILYS